MHALSIKSAMFVSDVARESVRLLGSPVLLAFCVLLASCNAPEDVHGPDSVATAADSGAALSDPTFSGSDSCRDCHQVEFAAWTGSHHAQAMQHATPDTVRGDFADSELQHFNSTTTFFTRESSFFVRTENANGALEEFAVAYTFGVDPLQQYLVEFADGRMQVLPAAWDTRPASEGGQRWFHLYPDEAIESSDPLHWTRREQNWNFMCAECHSTNLEKNYAVADDEYATTWSEINVGCEACHGPGSAHLAQARSGDFQSQLGLLLSLDDTGRSVWEMNPDTGIAVRSEIRMRLPAQPEACGRCHSRRAVTSLTYEYGQPLLDTHAPVLLTEGLYFADGQVRDEVYVYGSFLQSRMYEAGVTCSDCHDPHSGNLRTGPEPDAVCATCHSPQRFATTEHHSHATEVVGCVDCHMPSRDYMVVDGRRDHSFRIPEPALTLATGAPNACNGCHAEKNAQWAQDAIGELNSGDANDHFGYALHAARSNAADANEQLLATIGNRSAPGIARATALTELRPPHSQDAASSIRVNLSAGDALVRIGALRALAGLAPEQQIELGGALLSDEVRSVRIEAARVFSSLRTLLNAQLARAFAAAELEMIAALKANAERPEAATSLAGVYADAGDFDRSESEFLRALRLAPKYTIARINMVDLYRGIGRDEEAEDLLREGLLLTPEIAALHHSLGLLLVRSGREESGLESLRQAVSLDAANSRYVYVYAVALNSLSQPAAAIELLVSVRDRFASDFDIHWALATMQRDQGETEAARETAAMLAQRFPGNRRVDALLSSLDE